jgi:hypothetical protein
MAGGIRMRRDVRSCNGRSRTSFFLPQVKQSIITHVRLGVRSTRTPWRHLAVSSLSSLRARKGNASRMLELFRWDGNSLTASNTMLLCNFSSDGVLSFICSTGCWSAIPAIAHCSSTISLSLLSSTQYCMVIVASSCHPMRLYQAAVEVTSFVSVPAHSSELLACYHSLLQWTASYVSNRRPLVRAHLRRYRLPRLREVPPMLFPIFRMHLRDTESKVSHGHSVNAVLGLRICTVRPRLPAHTYIIYNV